MKKIILAFLLLSSVYACAQNQRNIPFDNSWRFTKESVSNAEQANYNDTKWRIVDLPHDWSIEDLPNQKPDSIIGPFDRSTPGAVLTGFTRGGTGWYRKKFITGKTLENKTVTIYFDGVYINSDVWLNGHHLGDHRHGYTPFYFDLTPFLKPAGQENVLAVRVQNEGKTARWYSGSGIYRHVWLTATGPVHVVPWGVCITTPQVSGNSASVQVKTSIDNEMPSQRTISLVTTLLSYDGKAVGSSKQMLTLKATTTKLSEQSITITNPALWSVETPRLYKAITEIKEGNKTIDRVETMFGIRTLSFTAQQGFLLNGKRVLLKGGCIHHDNGPLGSAAIYRAEERKIEILKKNGFNAVRLSHNPPSTQLLDICDRLGMLVINEAFDMWEHPKNPQDYHLYFKDWWQRDLDAMVLRDRNHPSVIMWSIGNEINERADSSGLRITKMLRDEVRRLDDTRPVTAAICTFWDKPGYKWDASAPAFALLDVAGYNYLWRQYEGDHQKFPNRIILGTESYPKDALKIWYNVEKQPYVIGDFVWTAMDYLGEASLGHAIARDKPNFQALLEWPWFNAWCGDIDLIGNKKPQSYYRDVVWRRTPIAMAVHTPIPDGMKESVSPWGWPDEQLSWTWPGMEGKPLQVRVFSRTPTVRLYLNEKQVGEQKIEENNITAVFNVPYQPGTLRAVAVVDGKETDMVKLRTTGSAKRIRLTPDRRSIHASRNDLSYVMVEVVDESGEVVPTADIPVHFSLKGAGEILSVGNANPTDVSSFKKHEKKTFHGKCLVIVSPTENQGVMSLTATAEGLLPAQVTITSHKMIGSNNLKIER